MKNYDDLSAEEQKDLYNKAHSFLHDHSDHVHNLFDKKTPSVAPSGSDMFHPELWKGIHWVWFFTSLG